MKTRILECLRWVCAVAVVVFIISGFSGSGTVSNTPIESMETAVTAALDMSTMQRADNRMIHRLYGLNPADFEGCVLYYPTSNMGAEELLIVWLRDESQQQTVSDAVAARLETQKTSFEGYGVEQYDLLTAHSILDLQGNYILFVVNSAAENALAAFTDAL